METNVIIVTFVKFHLVVSDSNELSHFFTIPNS